MKKIAIIKKYFEEETKGFSIEEIKKVDTKNSYLFSTDCYSITTKENIDFCVFRSDTLPMNLYTMRQDETINECYFKHIGLMTELCSSSLNKNFILDFLNNNSIFPILDRKLMLIEQAISTEKNATQLKGVANQIRDCYLDLTDYLMNKSRTNNPDLFM